MKKFILILSLMALSIFALEPRGIWLTEGGKAKIQVWDQNGKLFAKIVWLKEPNQKNGKPKVDANNPNASLRHQPIQGLILLRDLKPNGDDTYEDGNIYDPESGKTYACKMEQKNANTLIVRGFLGVSLFGRSQTWTRSNL